MNMKKRSFILFLSFMMILSISVPAIAGQTNQSSGAVFTWGNNSFGQLGIGTTSSESAPVLVDSDGQFEKIAVSSTHSAAIKTDGSLWTWGRNLHGQLGDGTKTDSYVPVRVGEDSDWIAVSAGAAHSLALKSDGSLWSWGYGNSGQLGQGSRDTYLEPVQVGLDTDWKMIEAGPEASYAIKEDHTLWAWGGNIDYVLGDGTQSNAFLPKQVGQDSDWRFVSAAQKHVMAIKNNGSLWTWGNNNFQQMGLSDGTGNYTFPVQVGSSTDWKMVSAALTHTLALKQDSTLWAWGNNAYYQLGFGDNVNRSEPEMIQSDYTWSFVTAGVVHSAALTADGSLFTWGTNTHGQLGNGTTETSTVPTEAGLPRRWMKIAAKSNFMMAIEASDNDDSNNENDNLSVEWMTPVSLMKPAYQHRTLPVRFRLSVDEKQPMFQAQDENQKLTLSLLDEQGHRIASWHTDDALIYRTDDSGETGHYQANLHLKTLNLQPGAYHLIVEDAASYALGSIEITVSQAKGRLR